MGYQLLTGEIEDRCFAKIKDTDEPYFIFEARDPFAPNYVRLWVEKATQRGLDRGKAIEALGTANEMVIWFGNHTAPKPIPENWTWNPLEPMPIFCLRGQDSLAPEVLRSYVDTKSDQRTFGDYKDREVNLIWMARPLPTILEVIEKVYELESWRPRKLPD